MGVQATGNAAWLRKISSSPGKLGTVQSGALEALMWKAAEIPTQEENVHQSGNILRILREDSGNRSFHFIHLPLHTGSVHLWVKSN